MFRDKGYYSMAKTHHMLIGGAYKRSVYTLSDNFFCSFLVTAPSKNGSSDFDDLASMLHKNNEMKN
jgi:hypothetical protein